MDEIQSYIAANADIKTVALFVDNGEELDYISDFISNTNLNKLYVLLLSDSGNIGYVKEQLIIRAKKEHYSLPQKLVIESMLNFDGCDDSEWALCFDCSEGEMIADFLLYKPKWLIGAIGQSHVDAFSIWEKYRHFCEHILIKTFFKDGRKRVLDWHKKSDNNIELSVILPMYNVEKYIGTCLDSLTKWKADYVEFLVVNDGSTDRGVDVVQKYIESDPRIILINKENGGCASARKTGLDYARGNYVGFIDPDDFTDETMYKKLLNAALEGSFDISLCGYNEYYEDSGKIVPAPDALWEPYISGCYDANKIQELIVYARVAIWRGIYRKQFLNENSISFYTDLRRFDDLPFKVETYAFAKSIVMVPEYLYYYRLEREGQDVSANDERLYVHFDIFNHLNNSIGKTRNQKLIDYLQMCKLQTHRYALSKILAEYKQEYIKRTIIDFDSLSDFKRTYAIANKMISSDVAEDSKKIYSQEI